MTLNFGLSPSQQQVTKRCWKGDTEDYVVLSSLNTTNWIRIGLTRSTNLWTIDRLGNPNPTAQPDHRV
jgi:hypothetical protein